MTTKKTLVLNKIVDKFSMLHDLISNKTSFTNSLFLFFFFLTFNGYSQLSIEYFEGGIPSTWANKNNNVGTSLWTSTTDGYLGSKSVVVNPALDNIGQNNTAQYYLITPQFKTPANGEIRFYTKQGSVTNNGTIYQVRVSTASQPDISSFSTVLKSWTETTLNTNPTEYEEKIVSTATIPPGLNIYIAFVAVNKQTGNVATGDSWFVDNVRVISACTAVTGITTSPNTNSAEISWTHPTATNFEIQVLLKGTSPASTGTPVTGTSYTATNLLTLTEYDVYIKTVCDPTTSSTWAGPFPFVTKPNGLTCASPIIIPPDVITAPYILSSNLDRYYEDANYVTYDSRTLSCQPIGADQNLLNGNHIYLSYTPTTSGLVTMTQEIEGGGGENRCYNLSSSVFVFDGCLGVGTSEGCLGAIETKSSVTTASISNFNVEAGKNYIIIISSPYTHNNPGAGICFNFSIKGSNCPAPSEIILKNLKESSVEASWNNVENLISKWQYVAIQSTLGAPNGSENLLESTTNVGNSLTGLLPNTNYNLYIRSLCNGIPGEWGKPKNFTTQCSALPLPYYTGFTNANSNTPEPCWTILNLNNDERTFRYGNNGSSIPVAQIGTGSKNYITDDMLVSPKFNLDLVQQQRLRFKYLPSGKYIDNTGPVIGESTFEIRISTTGIGKDNFETVLVPLKTYQTDGLTWKQMIVPIPENIKGEINIAWYLPNGTKQTSSSFQIDDVYIENLPPCSEPQYPIITPGSITTTTAEISWENGYNTSQWEIIAQPLGSGIPSPETPGIIVYTNPYTLTNLIPSTRYEVYVRSYCGAANQSVWVGPATFNTGCIAQPTPYYESLNNDDVNSKKFCWTTNNVQNDRAYWEISNTEALIYPAQIMSEPFSSYDDWLISVPISAEGQHQLKFKYRAYFSRGPVGRGNVEVLMSKTSDFSTYTTLIPSFDFTNEEYEEKSVIFNATGTFYIAFRVPPTMSNPGNSGTVNLDDFEIAPIVACPAPIDLTTSDITTNSAKLNWVKGYTESKWEVVIQKALSGVPTNSGISIETTPTYNATGLSPDTAYEYYVRAVCNDPDKSLWTGPYSFRTTCNPLETPFIETFDSNSTTESCWRVIDGNENDNQWNLNQPVQPIFGDQMAAMFSGTNGKNDDWLISPTLTIKPNQRLRYFYKTKSSNFTEDVKIKLSTNGTNIDQFTKTLYENSLYTTTAASYDTGATTVTLTSDPGVRIGDYVDSEGIITSVYNYPTGARVTAINGLTVTFDIPAWKEGIAGQTIAFTHDIIKNVEAKEKIINLDGIVGNVNFAIQIPYYPARYFDKGQFLFVDNFIIEDIPVCPNVINVTTSEILDTSAKVSWEVVGSETAWEISVQPLGTAAPIGDTKPEYLVTTDTNPTILNDLNPSSVYQYYIRSVCSENDKTEWIGPFEFQTKCDIANMCRYTFSLTIGNTGHVVEELQVIQNNKVVKRLRFPYPGKDQPQVSEYEVYLCKGVEFNLYYDGFRGLDGSQFAEAQVVIKNENDVVVWTSPLGVGKPFTTIYSGVSSCGVVTCPQPTNVSVNNQGTFSWTAGANETQWEVAVMPYINAISPQSGQIINSPSYTPIASDFIDQYSATNKFFVRAICGENDKSYWSGPKVYVRNDEPSTAIALPVNTGSSCDETGTNGSFIGATPSTTPTSCGGNNGGDIWYDFIAKSKVHTITLSDLAPGEYYGSFRPGEAFWPKIIMSLYEVLPDGSLSEMSCSENLTLITMYSSELVVGNKYMIRIKLDETIPVDKTFTICITTPEACDMDAYNYDFELPAMQVVTNIYTIINSRVVPGWRVNTEIGSIFFKEANNSLGTTPYSGGQCIQLINDDKSQWDPNDPNIKGLYKDFDTSEIIQMDYSFATATARNNTTIQLYAGPPNGPFTLITEKTSNNSIWELVKGSYMVPTDQKTTRFIFRVKNYESHHLLDAANFVANTDIITTGATLSCSTSTVVKVQAQGVGSWEADAKNPAPTLIATPNSKATDISGFSAPGDYVFHWKTRYCDKTITYNYLGINDKPVVENPTIYCLNSVATPLTATVPSGFTAVWYNQEFGGTGSTTAPTPDTSAAGNSQKYYVAALDAVGCEGPRVEIVVQVNDLPTATISGNTTICPGSTAVVSFTGTPDATVTYTVDSGAPQTIVLDASGNASITTPVLNANSTYALISVATAGTPSCSQTVTGSVTITVNSLPSATISAITPICSGNTSEVLIVGTPNATVTYTVDAGAEQTVVLDPLGNATIITPVLTANSTYTLVNIAFEGSADCSQALNDSVVIVVNGLPTAAISSDITICSGATAIVTFVGTPNATIAYKADTVDATVALDASGNASVITPVLTANSTYELVSATSAGTPVCTQLLTGSMLITVNPLPTATISGTTTICSGSTAEITFSGTPNTIVTYSVNSATATVTLDASGNATITTPAVASTTTYNLVSVAYTGTSDCSQSLTGSATVSVLELPTASISGTTTVCPGATAVITFTGTPNATVTYTVDAVSATIALDATGNASLTTPVLTASSTYQLVSVATNGTPACSQSVSGSAVITLSSPEFTITASPESLCANQEGLLTVNVTNNTSGAPVTYTYTLPDGSTQVSSSNTLAINAIGTYTVGVNIQGCENSNSITVNENTSAFDISFEQGCNANSYQLTALIDDSLNPENATYTWSGPSFEETENGNTIVLKAAGSYSVSITTADGCTSSDSVMVNSIACLIQQGISPNNDGKNDNFDLEALNVKHLSIYNRYGSKVYDMANYTNQWYGTTNDGKELPDGTYYYVIERDGMESVTGWIYVIHEHK